jgi:hypothetical protein
MSNFGVVALDPGGTTGWATFNCDKIENPLDGVTEYVDWSWGRGQLDWNDHHNDLDVLLGTLQVQDYTVVCEGFEYRNRARAGLVLVSRDYIGVAKRFCQERKVPYVEQTAAQAKGFVADRHIRKLGLWYSGNKHAMDATRHLLYYLIHTEGGEVSKSLLTRGWK